MTIEGQVLSQFEIVPPDHLFHYTTMEGMEAILSSRRIWASDIHRMNDASELLHALEIIRERLIFAHDRCLDSMTERILQTLIDSVDDLSSTPLYISCFSAEGDLLNQWRAYCPQEGGGSRWDSILNHLQLRTTQLPFSSPSAFTIRLISES